MEPLATVKLAFVPGQGIKIEANGPPTLVLLMLERTKETILGNIQQQAMNKPGIVVAPAGLQIPGHN